MVQNKEELARMEMILGLQPLLSKTQFRMLILELFADQIEQWGYLLPNQNNPELSHINAENGATLTVLGYDLRVHFECCKEKIVDGERERVIWSFDAKLDDFLNRMVTEVRKKMGGDTND